ncbi:glycosyl hydrolase family 28-related protein, partial [Bacillus sp. JJ664]
MNSKVSKKYLKTTISSVLIASSIATSLPLNTLSAKAASNYIHATGNNEQLVAQSSSKVKVYTSKVESVGEISKGTVVVGNKSYKFDQSLKGFFSNTTALKSAKIQFKYDQNRVIKQLLFLELNNSGKASKSGDKTYKNNNLLDAKGTVISGKIRVNADYITLKNITTSKDLELTNKVKHVFYTSKVTVKGKTITSSSSTVKSSTSSSNSQSGKKSLGQAFYKSLSYVVPSSVPSVTQTQVTTPSVQLVLVFENSKLSKLEIKGSGSSVQTTGQSTIGEITLVSNAFIQNATGSTITRLNLQNGANQVSVNGSISSITINAHVGQLVVSGNTTVTLSNQAQVDAVTTSGNLTLNGGNNTNVGTLTINGNAATLQVNVPTGSVNINTTGSNLQVTGTATIQNVVLNSVSNIVLNIPNVGDISASDNNKGKIELGQNTKVENIENKDLLKDKDQIDQVGKENGVEIPTTPPAPTTGSGGGGSSVILNPINVSAIVVNEDVVSFTSDVAGADIKWNGILLADKTKVGKNEISVPLIESNKNNELSIEKSGYVTYSNKQVKWVDVYDTNATLGSWTTDRSEPKTWGISEDEWITHSTTEQKNASNWYDWQGKGAQTNVGLTDKWKVESKIDLTNELTSGSGVRTSMWVQVDGINADAAKQNNVLDWAILQYKYDADSNEKGWESWDSTTGTWIPLTGISTATGVYTLTMTYDQGKLKQYINGQLVRTYNIDTDEGFKVSSPSNVIIQSRTFGESYTTKWQVPTVHYVNEYPTSARFVSNASELTSAIANAKDGDSIYLKAGVYALDAQIRIDKSVDLIGSGDSTVITTGSNPWTNVTGSKGYASLITVASGNKEVNLENLKVDGAKNIIMTGAGTGTDYGSGINVVSSSNVTLRNVTSTNNDAAGLIVNSSSVSAENLITNGNKWYGVNVDKKDRGNSNFTLTGNGVIGEDIQILSDLSSDVQVTANQYNEYKLEGTTKTIWNNKAVKNIASLTHDTKTTYYSNVANAVAAAVNGDVIRLSEGTFKLNSQIRIDKGISIIGAGESTVIKKGDANWTNDTGSKGYASLITVISGEEAVNLENLTVEGARNITMTGSGSGTDYGTGINIVSSSDVTLKNVTSKGNDAAGIIVNSSIVRAENLRTLGNKWYGVNVEKKDSVNASFTLTGDSLIEEDIQIFSGTTENVAINATGYDQYSFADSTSTIWNNKAVKNVATLISGQTTRYYSSVVNAVAAAVDGGVIRLSEGTFRLNSQIRINKAISIIGAGVNTVITKGNTDWTNDTG